MIRFAIYVIVLPNKFIDISFKIKISILINFEKLSSFRIGRGIQNKKNLFALSPNSAVKVFQQKYPDAKDVYVIKIYSEEKSNLKDMPKNQEANKKSKRYGIWAWVGAIYGPIIFWILFVNLPKIEWKYVFESNKTKVARHHEKAKEIGLPGIPYWRNSGTAAILYVNEFDSAFVMCGPDFFCSKELNEKKGIHFMPISGGVKRVKSNVVFAGGRFWCDSYDIEHAGKCRSGGWVRGER